jgi:hypothetical protein
MPENALFAIIIYLTVAVGLIIVGISVVGAIAFTRPDKTAAMMFSQALLRSNLTQMLTITYIILGACFLRAYDKISAEAVVSIISGVAGYVLGGTSRRRHASHVIEPQSLPQQKAAEP